MFPVVTQQLIDRAENNQHCKQETCPISKPTPSTFICHHQ